MKAFILLAGCLCLVACGGDSQNTPAPAAEQTRAPERPSEAPADDRPVIVAFGDSLTAGHGAEPGKSYPDFLQQMLDDAGYKYRVVNAGISGDTTSGGLSRVDSVVAMNPQIVILELGANDGLRGLPTEATRSNLEEMIVSLKQTGAKVVLAGMTLPRNYGPDYIRGFEKVFTGLARKHSAALVPFLLEGVADNPALMQSDGLHPTAEGNRRVAATVMKTLAPLLRK